MRQLSYNGLSPFPTAMPAYFQLDTWKQISMRQNSTIAIQENLSLP